MNFKLKYSSQLHSWQNCATTSLLTVISLTSLLVY